MQGVAEAESRRAADAAEAAYRETFNRGVAPDEGRMDAEHARALAVAQAVFSDAAVGGSCVPTDMRWTAFASPAECVLLPSAM